MIMTATYHRPENCEGIKNKLKYSSKCTASTEKKKIVLVSCRSASEA